MVSIFRLKILGCIHTNVCMTMSRLATLLVFATTLGALAFTAAPALAAGDANEAHCGAVTEASPGFRGYLPDCRAYELVTPVFKDGAELEVEGLSEDGSSVLARTLGSFAGLENNTNLNGGSYKLSRSASGWTVEAISPPSFGFPAQELFAATPELASTLWVTRTSSESIAAANFYIREADGAMVKVGPLLRPAAAAGPPSNEFGVFLYRRQAVYVDASADLSHVLFKIERGREFGISWPGDATNGLSSLYEYVGRGQSRPELVGLNNEGHQISTCDTWLGSLNSGDVYNAVSGDGSRVFFTAVEKGVCGAAEGPEVNELYARVDGLETVPISEPTTGAHGSCGACNDSERRSAEFAGASQNGSRVFFLTGQELLPGAKGVNLYEYDFEAPVSQRVSQVSVGGSGEAEVQGVARVSEDGSHVYFVARGRLGEGPRGGVGGSCLGESSLVERAQEQIAQEKEEKAEPVTTGAKCRPVVGAENLYVYQRDASYPAGRVSFIATLCSGEDASGTANIAQCPSPQSDESDWGASDQRHVQTTPDGRFLVFQSAGDLTADDASHVVQVFEYDAVTGELARISREQEGYTPEASLNAEANEAEIPAQGYSESTSPTVADKVAVSNDGSVVVFSSRAALTPEAETAAAAKVKSAYEYRSSVAAGGRISEAGVYLVSGESTAPIRGVEGMDGSAGNVFFVTSGVLVPQDSDSQFDTYDARVEGGFLAPDPPAECVAEACEENLYAPPAVAAPESSSLSAPTGAPTSAPITVSAPVVKKLAPGVVARRVLLARALHGCTRIRESKRRVACESAALRRYGPRRKVKQTSRQARRDRRSK
jgi:hypothetical protein